jgi:thioredoxin reductase (NADPH)
MILLSSSDEQVVTGVKALNKTTDETFDMKQLDNFVTSGHKPNTRHF